VGLTDRQRERKKIERKEKKRGQTINFLREIEVYLFDN